MSIIIRYQSLISIPYFFRVTGLFVESVPYVTYLTASLVYFEDRKNLATRNICLFYILFSGAKIGLVFIFFYFLLRIIKNDFSICKWLILLILPTIALLPVIDHHLDSFQNIEILHSIYYRYDLMINTFDDFSSDINGLLFGKGYISSYELMTRNDIKIMRGNDFFSMYIYSNGIIGSLVLLIPLLIFIVYLTRPLPIKTINLLFIVLSLSLLSIGTFTVFNYAYLAGIACLLSWRKNETINHYSCL